MKQYIDKSVLVAEIKKRLLPVNRDKHYDEWEEGQDNERIAILGIIDTFKVKEVDLEEAAIEYCSGNRGSDARVRAGFLAGANWQKENLWKPADGDDLPELEREVVVFTQKEGLSPKVGIAHRPDPKGWDGTSISTGKTEHFEPMLYGKGGWSIPDVKIWLDCPMPYKEGGEE